MTDAGKSLASMNTSELKLREENMSLKQELLKLKKALFIDD
jgi:hypothetical protein